MAPNEFNEKEIPEVEQFSEVIEETPSKKKIEYDESLFENSTIFGASTVTVKKRKLKPLTKGLILSSVAIVVAVAILVVTVIIPNMNDDNTGTVSLSSTPTYTVTSIPEAEVNKVTVFNANHPDGYVLNKVYNEADDTSSASSSGSVNYTWRVEGLEKYDLMSTKYLVQAALAITSNKKYDGLDTVKADDYEIGEFRFGDEATESREDTNIYGFDTPYSVVVVERDSGIFKIVVGNNAPDNSGRYTTVTGDDSIYVVSETKLSYFASDCKDMVGLLAVNYMLQTEENADYYSDNSLVRIDNIKLGGTCRKTNITIESPPDELSAITYVVTSPVFRACDEDAVNKILSVATSGLANSGAYVLGYTDADVAKYGLDNPYSTVEINIGSYKVSLKFGAPIDGFYPCIVDGKDIIYRIPVGEGTEENPDWISYKDTDVYYESLYLEYITGISSINMEFADKQATFKLNHTENENGSKTFTVECDEAADGVTIEKKQMSFLYGRILNISAESITQDTIPDTEPYLTITVNYTDKSKSTDIIRMYKATTRRYYYTLNGKGNALVAANRVEDLYARMNDLLNGIEIKRGN